MSLFETREASEYKCPICNGAMEEVTRPVNHTVYQCVDCEEEFGSGYLTGWNAALAKNKTSQPETYTRPELTDEDKKQAEADAKNLLKKYGYTNFPKMLAALCIENVRLIKEINEHRATLGIEPLPTFEV